MLSSGLTLIFSMMGVLNFAHASFYMLGAYFAYAISARIGFWPALVLAPLAVGAVGMAVERWGLRAVHKHGHVAELLFTFGLAYLIEEFVHLVWGRPPVDYRIPAALDGPLFTIYGTSFPIYRGFMMLVSVGMLAALYLALTRTRIGLVIQASLTHPHMVEALGHDVPRVFMLVFGGGAALAGLAGVIGGNAFVTEPGMAALVGAIVFVVVVVGGMGSLAGAFVASLLIGCLQTFSVALDWSVAGALAGLGFELPPGRFLSRAREHHRVAGGAGAALPADGADARLPPARDHGNARVVTTRVLRFAPLDLGRWLVWGGTAAVLLAAPHLFTQGFALTLMSQMGIMVIFALSYNMLLGQSGMLSFGHAVYSGLGAYFAVHALNLIGKGALALPVAALPLVGGVFGALFGVIFGWVTTRKSGTTFAMISLGIGEMVAACSLMLPGFFGGEGGVTANRTAGPPFLGLTFGPAIQVYYLIAVWTFASMAAMYALTRTPLGRIANAVRDNAERAEFIGYDTQTVRFLQLVLSAFFAGVAGGLSAINFEIVTAENVGVMRSGGVLLATFIGGVGFFFGPVIGAIVFTFFIVWIANVTKAWLLYLGLFFVGMVLFAPGGIASLIVANLPGGAGRALEAAAPAYGAPR